MSVVRLRIRLEPDHAERADQSQQGANLKLPLPNDDAFLWEKCQRQQRCKNSRRPSEYRIHTRTHVEKGHHLSDLMDYIRQARQKAKPNCAQVDPRSAAVHLT